MAKRPIFLSNATGSVFVSAVPVEFLWHPGMSKSQKQKSIRSLHESAQKARDINKVLEISSKSEEALGVQLSAFNLSLRTRYGAWTPVEVLFQASKVFSHGGPFTDILDKSPREAKKDDRLRVSGSLVGFRYEGRNWPLNPQTVFYDWLYLTALRQNPGLAERLLIYEGFSDIEFNPQKSINCQAASAALYKSLVERDLIDLAMSSPEEFIRVHVEQRQRPTPIQSGLF